MARPRDHKKHLAVAAEELVRSLARFIDLAGDAMQNGRATGHGNAGPTRGTEHGNATKPKRGPGKGNLKLKAKLKSYWANMTPEQRKVRIAKMHVWRKKGSSFVTITPVP